MAFICSVAIHRVAVMPNDLFGLLYLCGCFDCSKNLFTYSQSSQYIWVGAQAQSAHTLPHLAFCAWTALTSRHVTSKYETTEIQSDECQPTVYKKNKDNKIIMKCFWFGYPKNHAERMIWRASNEYFFLFYSRISIFETQKLEVEINLYGRRFLMNKFENHLFEKHAILCVKRVSDVKQPLWRRSHDFNPHLKLHETTQHSLLNFVFFILSSLMHSRGDLWTYITVAHYTSNVHTKHITYISRQLPPSHYTNK